VREMLAATMAVIEELSPKKRSGTGRPPEIPGWGELSCVGSD